jgi:hypothetical protein
VIPGSELAPLVPELPDEPLDPELPLDPDEPDVPEDPLNPELPDEPEHIPFGVTIIDPLNTTTLFMTAKGNRLTRK